MRLSLEPLRTGGNAGPDVVVVLLLCYVAVASAEATGLCWLGSSKRVERYRQCCDRPTARTAISLRCCLCVLTITTTTIAAAAADHRCACSGRRSARSGGRPSGHKAREPTGQRSVLQLGTSLLDNSTSRCFCLRCVVEPAIVSPRWPLCSTVGPRECTGTSPSLFHRSSFATYAPSALATHTPQPTHPFN